MKVVFIFIRPISLFDSHCLRAGIAVNHRRCISGTFAGVDEVSCYSRDVSRETFDAGHDCMQGYEAIQLSIVS